MSRGEYEKFIRVVKEGEDREYDESALEMNV